MKKRHHLQFLQLKESINVGCGVGGNAVKFIMEIEKYNYPEALKFIANKYNIEVRKELDENQIKRLTKET